MVDDKKQTNLYLSKDVVLQAHIEDINLSKLVNDYLESYFLGNDLEKITKEINTLEIKLKSLYKRRDDLVDKGEKLDREGTLIKQYKEKIYGMYISGKRYALTDENNILWLRSPNNQTRLRVIGLDPEDMLSWIKKKHKKEESEKDECERKSVKRRSRKPVEKS